MSDKYTVVFVLGGPGCDSLRSGKGTQCAKVVEKYGWAHFSAGDLLRKEVKSESEQGNMIQEIMNEGNIVPFEITIGLIHNAMKESPVDKFLIDGFPRALDQADAFESNVCSSAAMLFLDCPEEVMEQRLLGRSEGRSDDNPETVRKRFKVYQEQTMPVIEKFEKEGKLRTVKADRSPEEVFEDTAQVIESLGAAPSTEDAPVEGDATAPAAGAEPSGTGGDTDASEQPLSPTDANNAPTSEDAKASPGPLIDTSGLKPPVVIMGPSGVGKGTLLKRLMAEHGDKFAFTVSHTTRQARTGEEDGVAYVFVDRAVMQAAVNAGSFLEHAEVHGNLYGTSVEAVHACSAAGKSAVLEIDVQGGRQVKASPLGAAALFLFVKPPSLASLETRLQGRGSEDLDSLSRRLDHAKAELAAADDADLVQATIVNDDLDTAYADLCAALARHLGVAVEPQSQGADSAAAGASTGATNGTAAASTPAADGNLLGVASAATASTAGDPGAGSSAEPQSSPTDYLNSTVVGPLKEAMLALNEERPSDPIQFLIDHLSKLKSGDSGGASNSAALQGSLL